jgi:transposase
VRQGLRSWRQALPDILAKRTDALTQMLRLIEGLMQDWHHLDERIDAVTDEIGALVAADEACRRLMSVPGVGPIIASAMVAAIGNGAAFRRGRDFGTWLGLVPRQTSTGDRTILSRLSKRGNTHLRSLLVQAARVLLLWPAKWPQHSFGNWLTAASARLHHNVLAAALANKLARIAWSVLSQNRTYEPRAATAAG